MLDERGCCVPWLPAQEDSTTAFSRGRAVAPCVAGLLARRALLLVAVVQARSCKRRCLSWSASARAPSLPAWESSLESQRVSSCWPVQASSLETGARALPLQAWRASLERQRGSSSLASAGVFPGAQRVSSSLQAQVSFLGRSERELLLAGAGVVAGAPASQLFPGGERRSST